MLVNTHDGGVDRRDPVKVPGLLGDGLHLLQQSRPDALLGPAIEVLEDRVPVPESLGYVSPWSPGAESPSRRLDHRATVYRWPASSLRCRKQRPDHSPRFI